MAGMSCIISDLSVWAVSCYLILLQQDVDNPETFSRLPLKLNN
jgi:hypothetical protein